MPVRIANWYSCACASFTADRLPDGTPTGWYVPEAAHPYNTFIKSGAQIDLGSLSGGPCPVDKSSIEQFANDEESVAFYKDSTIQSKLNSSLNIMKLSFNEYDAVFFVGGHGPLVDFASSTELPKRLVSYWSQGGIISAVCHGPACLLKMELEGMHVSVHGYQ